MNIIHQNSKKNRTFYNDKEKNYCVYDIPNIVAVLPVLPNGDLVLVEQYRVPADARTIELVCGGIEVDEDVEIAAKREVKEETGYNVKKLKSLGTYMSCPAYTTEKVHLFIAYCEDTEGKQELEEQEMQNDLKKVIVNLEDALKLCKTRITRPELELALLKLNQSK
jgi:ADP-ribose pyrophosphatase